MLWNAMRRLGRSEFDTSLGRSRIDIVPNFAKPKSVHTALYYRRVHGGTYRYVPVYTAINQVYRIPDALPSLPPTAYPPA
jgi:hypothetical protein